MAKEVRANLRLTRIEPWSLIRTGFLISVSIGITMVTASVIIYMVLSVMGVFSAIDQLLGDLTGGAGALTDTVTLPVVFLSTFVAALFETVVTTALIALFGFIYNLTVPFTRGLQVTLAEDVVKPHTQLPPASQGQSDN
jgi:Transmembrane domain of unknown function (DUF3566)